MTDEKLEEIIELEARGYRASALRRLRGYLKIHPGDAEGWYYLARFSTKPRQQIAAIERALKLQPDYPEAEEYRAVLLEEYPNLDSGSRPRWTVVLLLIVLIGALAALLAYLTVLQFFGESEPEVVIVVPTTGTPQTAVPPLIISTNTPEVTATWTQPPTLRPSPTPLPPTATLTANVPSPDVSAGGLVTETPRPTRVPDDEPAADAQLVLIAMDDGEEIAEALRESFPGDDVAFEVGIAAQDHEAALVISGDSEALNVQIGEQSTFYLQSPALVNLSRMPDQTQITLELPELNAVVAYVAYQHEAVIENMAARFSGRVTSMDESDILLAYMLGYSYQALGQHTDALDVYDLLTAFTSDNPDPVITANRGLAFAETGDYESGTSLLRSVLESHPDPVLVQSTIGDIYATVPEGQSEAERAYNEALSLDANDPRPHVGLGLLQKSSNQFNAALEAFGTALAVDPGYVPAYYERATLRHEINLLDEALQDVDLAITFAPRVGELYALRGQILVQREEWELASRSLEQAMQLGVASTQLNSDLAAAYFELGNLDGAIRMSNAALAQDMDDVGAWYQRGRAYLAQNELGSAVNDFDQGLQRAPEHVGLLVARCTAHARLGDDGSATIDCDAALALDNDNGYALEQRGLIRARAGDRAGAAEDFAEAISYAPDAYEAHYFLGLYALQENRYPQAVESLSRAIELAPLLGKAHAARGVAYRITGEWEGAIDDLETALELVPEDVYSYYELGLSKRGLADATFDAGDSAAAEALYEEAAEALLEFLNASQPQDPFVAEAQAALDYVNSALLVVQEG